MSSSATTTTYHGRRAPNVSQYLANLNTIPTHDQLASEINLGEGDLDFLTNAEFFDFDSFHHPNVDAAHYNSNTHSQHHSPRDGAQYPFNEFQTYPTPVTPSNGPASASNGLHGHYPPQPAHQLPYPASAADKRKSSVPAGVPSPADLEEQSRMAAEEDKRRRNTAASARFRVKKKQREAALEKQAREMAEKVQQLEGKVQQLQMENKWLKGLITDKNDGKALESALEFALGDKDAAERHPSDHTTGVGTDDAPVADEESEDDMDDLDDA